MWTEEKFLETYKKFCKKWDETFPTSEKPKPLFKDGVFDQDNWNGCDLIRKYLCDYYYENNADTINGIEIFVVYKNDEWDAVILDYDKHDIYHWRWYKSRGRTSEIMVNSDFITMDKYLYLMNKLGIEEDDK